MLATIVIQLLCDFICLFFAVWCWRKQGSSIYKKFFLVNSIAFFSLILSDAYYNIFFRILHYDISESIDLMLTITLFVFEFGQFYCWRLLSKSQNYKIISYKNSPYIVFTAAMVATLTYYFITNSNLAPFEKTYQNISIAVDMFIWLYAITCLSRTRSFPIALLSLGCLILVSSSLTICCLFLFNMEKIISAEWLHMLWTFGTFLMAVGFILSLNQKKFDFCSENSIQVNSCSLLSTASVIVSLIGFSFLFLLHLTNSDGEGIRSMLWIFPIALVFAMITSVLLGNWFSRTIFLPVNAYLKRIECFNLGREENQGQFCFSSTYEFELLGKFIDDAFFKIADALKRESKIAAQTAHDIRSPLATINMIVKESNELEEQKRIILRNATQQLNDLANVLLVKYRSKDDNHSSEYNSIKNSEVIAVLLDLIVSEKRLEYKNLPIVIEFDVASNARGAFAQIIISDFKRMISNIINNAIEAIHGKGRIKIYLSVSEAAVNIKITDSGIGMPPELIEKVFDGSITSNKKEGYGIGLVSAYQLVKSWGGNLKIESKLNVGTTIHLSFALLDSAPWFAANLNFLQGSKIIVLDDDQSIHDLWNSRFGCEISSANFRVQHFYQANELMQLDYNELKSSYFLCDYELIGQDKTGLDVIEKMNLSNSATLVTSRYDDKEIRRRCAELNIKILPKNYAAYVPICIIENNLSNLSDENQPDVILIDDDHLVINTWKFIAKKKNKIILTFDNFSDAEKGIERLSRTIPIYIDSNLGTKISGEECAKILSNKGFINLYLATGHNPSRFGVMPWIRAIVGKEPPF